MTCSAPECKRQVLCKGLCSAHYQRQRLGYKTRGPVATQLHDPFDRMCAFITVTGCCWLWTGALNADGYGVASDGTKRNSLAHNWVYEHLVGKAPSGFDADHICRVHNCVNPDHIEYVTRTVNLRRGIGSYEGLRTHCIKGHLMDDQTKYTNPKTGKSYCRECGKVKARIYRRRNTHA